MQKIENFAFSPGKWSKTSKMKTFDTFMTEILKNIFQFGRKNSKMSKSKVLLKLIFWKRKNFWNSVIVKVNNVPFFPQR